MTEPRSNSSPPAWLALALTIAVLFFGTGLVLRPAAWIEAKIDREVKLRQAPIVQAIDRLSEELRDIKRLVKEIRDREINHAGERAAG